MFVTQIKWQKKEGSYLVNNNKNRREMGLLSLSNLEICIKKAEFSDFKG